MDKRHIFTTHLHERKQNATFTSSWRNLWVPTQTRQAPSLLPDPMSLAPPITSPFVQKPYLEPTTSPLLFENVAPPDYSLEEVEGEEVNPPSFSEVCVTIDGSGCFVQAIAEMIGSGGRKEALPLYEFSCPINGKDARSIMIRRLYYKPSEREIGGIKRTAVPVYQIFKENRQMIPQLESAKFRKGIVGERKRGLGGCKWKFTWSSTAVKHAWEGRPLFKVSRRKDGAIEWVSGEEMVVVAEETSWKKEDRRMPVLKIVKELRKAEIDILVAAWCIRIWDEVR